MMRQILNTIAVCIVLLTGLTAEAQMTITKESNPTILAQKILGRGITIMNAQFKGVNNFQAGIFRAAPGTFAIDSGIVLTSGRVKSETGFTGIDAPASSNAHNSLGGTGDADLNFWGSGTGTPLVSFDACVLEFDFIPQGDSVYVRYVFASEEYPQYNCDDVTDAFVFLISGPGIIGKKRISNIPGVSSAEVPVAINSINNGIPGPGGNISNCQAYDIGAPFTQYYVNTSASQHVVYNGRTIILTAKAKVVPCQTYHIKLVIGDVVDGTFDSGVFLEANSFTSKKEISTSTQGPYSDPQNNNKPTLIEACKTGQITLTRNPEVTGAFTLTSSFANYPGTATPLVDFTTDMPANVTFAENENQKTFNFTATADAFNEGVEKIVARFAKGTCTTVFVDSAILYIKDSLIYRSRFDTSLCTITPINISAHAPEPSVTNSYAWNNGNTIQTITVTQPGTYIATHTYSQRCLNIDTFVIVSNDPTISITNTDPQQICPGETITLTANSTANSIVWNTGATTNSIQVSATGDYWVTGEKQGCIKADTITIVAKPVPIVNFGADTAICASGTVVLDATYPGATYMWNTGATTSSISVTTAGLYSVTNTLNGCTAKDTINVIVSPVPSVNLGVDTAICESANIQLNAGYAGASHQWNTGVTTSSITVNSAGTYSVINTLNGCIARDTINISVKPLPVVELGADTSICSYNSLQLNATNAGATYVWSTSATTSSITVNATGEYSVITTSNGCSIRDTIDVTVIPSPVVNLGRDTAICENRTIQLNAAYTGAAQQWNTGATTSSILVSTAGTYSVINTLNGCIARDTINIAVQTAPLINLGPDTSICEYDTFLLSVNYPGAAYTWSTGATDSSIAVSDSGMYTVTALLNGCSASDTIIVGLNIMPVANAGNDLLIPTNTTAQLNALLHANNASYLWSPTNYLSNAAIPNPVASPVVATEYTLQVISVDGCMAEDKAWVRISFPLVIPNAFSPNGDNINDLWRIGNIEFYPNSKVFVYNRYGQQVFFAEGNGTPWDGKSKNKPVQPSTYYYIIDIGEGRKTTGWVLLLR